MNSSRSERRDGIVPRELLQQRRANNGAEHPGARSLPSGIPEKNAVPAPFKIVQTPDLVVDPLRVAHDLPSDFHGWPGAAAIGRPADLAGVLDRPMGRRFARRRTAGFNGLTWLDMSGHPATDALRVTERFTRTSVGRIDLEITIDDPKA